MDPSFRTRQFGRRPLVRLERLLLAEQGLDGSEPPLRQGLLNGLIQLLARERQDKRRAGVPLPDLVKVALGLGEGPQANEAGRIPM